MQRILLLLFVFACCSVKGQELIHGMVADSATFAPLPYVNVLIKGKSKGTISDTHGNFRLVASSIDTLVFSFVGYNTTEIPLHDWESGIVLLGEKSTMLKTITIEDRRLDPYGDMFDEENELLQERNKKLPFYYTRAKKQKVLINRLELENIRVKTYVEVIIQNEDNKRRLIETYQLTEKEYYDILADFNAKHYTVMYYLTAGELISLVNNFYSARASRK
jgi:hypothetical protein